jgi:hypothetical protein
MKALVTMAAAAAAMVGACVSGLAQDARPYDQGPVWDFSMVLTKPGHFDEYMKFLDTTWKAEEEAMKAKGDVLDYKVFNAVDPRDGEPDLVLAVEYKNMAVFDNSLDEQDALMKKTFGSMPAANKADVDRESIRTLKGDVMTRELILK